MTPDDDGELMLRYARGDMHAFETLYRRHRSALYRYLVRQTHNTETANDLFQEVWSKVIASRARYEPRAKFSTFLYRVAHNCFIAENSMLCAQVGLAGSTVIGKNVILAGQVGVAGHCKIGDGVIVTAQSGTHG